jgi:uncharacterized NAD(P)/FAD-binding protein YdhS
MTDDQGNAGHFDRAPVRRIVIVGGGFSGAVVAVQLARLLPADAAVAIDIVEPRSMLGGGVAYSATDPAHRINVPAAKMTVFEDDPAQFDQWLRVAGTLREDPAAVWADGSCYPQRGVFGRYVAELVAQAAAGRPELGIRHLPTRVVEVAARPTGFTLRLERGEPLAADLLILAISHPPPAVPRVLDHLRETGAPIVVDPWRAGALDGIARDAAVLVVGTGLTMADVVAALEARGHTGPIVAISRRGLLSRGHPSRDPGKHDWFGRVTPPATALSLSRAVRRQVAEARREGRAWQAVFDDVRANAGRLWAALPPVEQRRLIRHLRPFWDVHRFRVAPQLEAAIERLRGAGQFRSMAASLAAAQRDSGRIAATLRRRGGAGSVDLVFDAVVVTTGPAHGSALGLNPVLSSLAARGLARADAAGLGVDVDAHSRMVGQSGVARPDLLVAGPLARGRFGELMGLPQVSQHAKAVAATAVAFIGELAAIR